MGYFGVSLQFWGACVAFCCLQHFGVLVWVLGCIWGPCMYWGAFGVCVGIGVYMGSLCGYWGAFGVRVVIGVHLGSL